MSPIRVMIIVVAAVAAIGLAIVMRGAFGAKPAPVAVAPAAAGRPTTRVLVAKRDMGVGERIQATDIGWQDWPADALNPAFITDGAAPTTPAEKPNGAAKAVASAGEMIGGSGPMQAWQNAIVREPILTGEPLMARKLVRDGEGGFMSVVLAPGKRAIALAVNVESGAGGFILPGDRVDVLQSREVDLGQAAGASQTKSTFVADTVLTNVRVLAIDQTTEPAKDAKSLIGSTATLEVGAADTEVLMRAKAQGPLVLALRALTDTTGPSGALHRDGDDDSGAANVIRVHRGGVTEMVGVRQ